MRRINKFFVCCGTTPKSSAVDIQTPKSSLLRKERLIVGKRATVHVFGYFFSPPPHMWFSSGWLKRFIWTLCENPLLHQFHRPTTTWLIHLHQNEISLTCHTLLSYPRAWKWTHKHTHTKLATLTFRRQNDLKVAEADCCRSARYFKSIVCFIIHIFVCLLFTPAVATQLLPLTIYTYTFLPPSLLLLLSACLCPGWERGNVFIVSVWN